MFMLTLNLTPSNNVANTGMLDKTKLETQTYAEDSTLEVYEVKSGEVVTIEMQVLLENCSAYFIQRSGDFYVVVSYTFSAD